VSGKLISLRSRNLSKPFKTAALMTQKEISEKECVFIKKKIIILGPAEKKVIENNIGRVVQK